jgi:hypothetical protein
MSVPDSKRRDRKKRPTFVIRLRPARDVDPIKTLRAALKVLGRRFGLKAVAVWWEDDQ